MSRVFPKLTILGLSALVGLIALTGGAAANHSTPDPDPGVVADHVARTQAMIEHATWVQAQADAIAKSGVEPYSAGFRLLRPVSDYLDISRRSFPRSSLRYDFAAVDRACADIVYTDVAGDGVEWGRTEVSLQRLFENDGLSMAHVVPVGSTGLFGVEVAFSDSGFQRVADLVGSPDPSDTYVDWYGNTKSAGAPVTPLRAVLVVTNRAHVPVSLDAFVAANQPGQAILVAKDLSDADAAVIVQRLGF